MKKVFFQLIFTLAINKLSGAGVDEVAACFCVPFSIFSTGCCVFGHFFLVALLLLSSLYLVFDVGFNNSCVLSTTVINS